MTHGAQVGTKARETIQANTKALEVTCIIMSFVVVLRIIHVHVQMYVFTEYE